MTMDVTTNLTGLTTVFSQLMTWIGDLVTTIASNPLLLVSLGIFVVGAVIGKLLADVKSRCIGETYVLLNMAIPSA